MRKQFIVQEYDIDKREKFYNYIKNKYNLDNWYPYKKELFINSRNPFVIDFNNNIFWISESITCNAAAASCNAIISIDEFKNIEDNKKKLWIRK